MNARDFDAGFCRETLDRQVERFRNGSRYALAEGVQGRGYMSEACPAGIDFIFSQVRLHRIMAKYMPANVRSAAVLKRPGFTIEGPQAIVPG